MAMAKFGHSDLVALESGYSIQSGSYSSTQMNDTSSRFSILKHFKRSLRFLQLFGLFPTPLSTIYSGSISTSKSKNLLYKLGVPVYLALCLSLNFFVLVQTSNAIKSKSVALGTMHALVIGSIIATIKPLINIFHFLIFIVGMKRHRSLLYKLEELAETFSHFFETKSVERLVKKSDKFSTYVILFALLFTFIKRSISSVLLNIDTPTNILLDYSLFLTPVMCIWNLIPLVYFLQVENIIHFYIRQLTNIIASEHKPDVQQSSIRFYYRLFAKLVQVQKRAADFFNPFIAFSFLWSVFVLCLTIYYIIMAKESFTVMPDFLLKINNTVLQENYIFFWYVSLFSVLAWITLQVLLAVSTLIVICNCGRKINEGTRRVFYTVLHTAAKRCDISVEDSFYINCFSNFIQLQSAWGVSVWKSVQLERNTIFQLVTIIMSYAMILLKFGDTVTSRACIMMQNATTSY